MRVADSLGEAITSGPVRTEIGRVWKLMNALERKPYIEKAQRVEEMKMSSTNGDDDGGGKKAAVGVAAIT